MKTTVEVPDSTFRRAKSKAAEQGMPLRQFVTEALEDKLRTFPAPQQRPWLKHVGKLRHLRKESKRINRVIEEHAEKIDAEMWR